MGESKLFVFSNPVAGREDEYNEWYDTIHLADLLGVPGIVGAQRFEAAAIDVAGMGPAPHAYAAVYDIEGDPAKAVTAMLEGVNAGKIKISDALDVGTVAMWAFSARGEHVGGG